MCAFETAFSRPVARMLFHSGEAVEYGTLPTLGLPAIAMILSFGECLTISSGQQQAAPTPTERL